MGIQTPIRRSRFGDIAVIVFLLAQASDGILTYVGVSTFGLRMEGNPVVAWLMGTLGYGAGLSIAKIAAGGFGIVLHLSSVHKAVAALAMFYLVVAIGPWMFVLFVWN